MKINLRLILSTDNGPHYHNTAVLTYLSEVNEVFNLDLLEYNNFEAGEGKTSLDTHFAYISHKIVRYVRLGNDLETGEELGQLVQVNYYFKHGMVVFVVLQYTCTYMISFLAFDTLAVCTFLVCLQQRKLTAQICFSTLLTFIFINTLSYRVWLVSHGYRNDSI